jgi:hypothetical protein
VVSVQMLLRHQARAMALTDRAAVARFFSFDRRVSVQPSKLSVPRIAHLARSASA